MARKDLFVKFYTIRRIRFERLRFETPSMISTITYNVSILLIFLDIWMNEKKKKQK